MIRSHPITSRPLALQGMALTEDTIQQRSDHFLSELKSELPCLQRLRRSAIIISFLSTDKGLLWVATLREFDLLPLFPTNHLADQDHFLQDVRALEAEKNSLPSRFIEATSAATVSSVSSSTSTLRRVLKAKQKRWIREHLTNEDLYQSLLSDGILPKILPTGWTYTGTFKVKSLNRLYAEIILTSDIESAHELTKELKTGTKWLLKRSPPFNSPQHGTILQIAMDKKCHIKAKLAVALTWENTSPAYLELQELLN